MDIDSSKYSHFKDFIMKNKIEYNNLFKDSKKSLVEYQSRIKLIIDICELYNFNPIIFTITVQILIRIIDQFVLTSDLFKYIIIISFKLANQLENDISYFHSMANISKIFDLKRKKLISLEKFVLTSLNYELFRDNIYNHFLTDEVETLILSKDIRKKYYEFISQINRYKLSSEENYFTFRKLLLKNKN